jgi:hypothetical protein
VRKSLICNDHIFHLPHIQPVFCVPHSPFWIQMRGVKKPDHGPRKRAQHFGEPISWRAWEAKKVEKT